MIPAPEFAPYPLAQPPVFSRWLAAGVALWVALGGAFALLAPHVEPVSSATLAIVLATLWSLALLLRLLVFRFNRHTAQHYEATAERVRQGWWAQHRQSAAWVDWVLVSAACADPTQAQRVFEGRHRPQASEGGKALRVPQVLGGTPEARERELARLLARRWVAGLAQGLALEPLRCYWQGSLAAWQVFAEQVQAERPRVRLPAEPEPWQGLQTLGAIIDRLHGMAPDARMLCGGCQSSAVLAQGDLPAGEAAVLWLLGPEGRVRFTRGEWYANGVDEFTAVAERVLLQGQSPVTDKTPVSFSQPHAPALDTCGWPFKPLLLDSHFGELEGLQAMVAQTLAAWRAHLSGAPSLWLATDPHHTLALGVVEPDESIR